MTDALWMGVPISIIRRIGMWRLVRFQHSCGHFKRGDIVCVSDFQIVERTPVPCRTPVIPTKRRPYEIRC